MNKFYLIILILFSFTINIGAEEIDKNEYKNNLINFIELHGDRIIKDINVKGNFRTKIKVIINKMNVKEGDNLSKFDPEHFIQSLRRLNLYDKINIEYIPIENKLAAITVKLSEKISLLPLPYIQIRGDSETYALFLVDKNFLGYQKIFLVGAFTSTEGFGSLIGYRDPSVMNSKYFLDLRAGIGDREFENADTKGEIYRRYFARFNYYTFKLGYKVDDNWNVSLQNRYDIYNVNAGHSESIDAPESGEFIFPSLLFEFDNLYFSNIFKYGIQSSLELIHGVPVKSGQKDFNRIELNLKYNKKIIKDDLFIYNISGGVGDESEVLFNQIAGTPGYRTLPFGQVFTNNYFGTAFNYETPFYKNDIIVATITGFYEAGGFRNVKTDNIEYFHGPGAGLRVYLTKIAVQAVGFDIAQNLKTNNIGISLVIGYSR